MILDRGSLDVLMKDMREFGQVMFPIREDWLKHQSTPKRWAIIRRAYRYMTPRILARSRTSPYFLDWLPTFTPIEYDAWISIRQLGMPMFPQYPVGRYFVDFGDPQKKIAIECDGKQWHDPEKDAKRDAELIELGWIVYRFAGRDLRKGEDSEDAAHHGIRKIFDSHYLGVDA